MKLYVTALLLPFVLADSYSQCQCIAPNGGVISDSGFTGSGCTGGPETFNCPNYSDFYTFGEYCQVAYSGGHTAGCCIDNAYDELACTPQSDGGTCGTYCS